MLRVGLTGGLGSGKSTVAALFEPTNSGAGSCSPGSESTRQSCTHLAQP
jgi:hypothetical protein